MKKMSVRRGGSIHSRIRRLAWLSAIPVMVICAFLVGVLHYFSSRYNRIVQNITSANEYNISFENNINDSMYYIVTGTYDWPDLTKAGQDKNPYTMIRDIRLTFRDLEEETDNADLRRQTEAILRLLDILQSRVDDIVANVEEGNHFDENMDMLESNIYILTDLIQGDLEQYITAEAADMEVVRQEMSEQARNSLFAAIAVLLAYLIGMIIISNRVSKRITQPIRELCDKSEIFAQGDFSVQMDVRNQTDEIATLGSQFNSMVGEIAQLVDDVRKEQKSLEDTELRLLQAQINPHFLYNTLDAIMWLTEAGENQQAVSMLSSLSDFFRTTLSQGRDLVTISEERTHIQSYLEIQKIRYQDILDYRIDFDEDILPAYIQKMTLQPVVENALYHGIKNKRGKGMILVGGRRDKGAVLFTVKDDGIGMTEEQLRHLRGVIAGTEKNEYKGHGFGMANVEKRIRLKFGEGYGLTVDSVYGEGCTVEVRIPYVAETDKSRISTLRTGHESPADMAERSGQEVGSLACPNLRLSDVGRETGDMKGQIDETRD